MSLKSFDKFCEKIIMGEVGSEKEIYDERQNQIRTKLIIEALVIFGTMTALGTFLYDILKWCESTFSICAICCAAAYLWWTIRALFNGCLFGVSGKGTIYTALILIVECTMYTFLAYRNSEGEFFSFENGLSRGLAFSIDFALAIFAGVIVVAAIFVIKNKTAQNGEKKDS